MIGSVEGGAMSDNNVTQSAASADQSIEQIIERCEPMGNLDDLVIDDLTEEDEDEFFGILEDV